MRIIAAVIISLGFCLIAGACLYAIFNTKSKKRIINLHWRQCTNLKESNINEQRYVQKVYAIEGLIISVFVFSFFMCFIFEQFIAAWSLFGATLLVLGVIELVLLKCKKFQECKYEISDKKRLQEYCENLRNKTEEQNTMPIIEDNNVEEEV